ncbi:hypothetical protein R1flu_008893 [Riccia fluitans]|uniref:Uncharacterized protein n=1 Tax=Riccia fluitans TaxID=41844 RepID=A0ABD1Z0I6_9MARC
MGRTDAKDCKRLKHGPLGLTTVIVVVNRLFCSWNVDCKLPLTLNLLSFRHLISNMAFTVSPRQDSPRSSQKMGRPERGNPHLIPQTAAAAESFVVFFPGLVKQRLRNMSLEGIPPPADKLEVKASATKQEESSKKEVEVFLDEQRQRFRTPDGKAYLQYVIEPVNRYRTSKQIKGEDGKQVMLMQHTFVPAVFRGQDCRRVKCLFVHDSLHLLPC